MGSTVGRRETRRLSTGNKKKGWKSSIKRNLTIFWGGVTPGTKKNSSEKGTRKRSEWKPFGKEGPILTKTKSISLRKKGTGKKKKKKVLLGHLECFGGGTWGRGGKSCKKKKINLLRNQSCTKNIRKWGGTTLVGRFSGGGGAPPCSAWPREGTRRCKSAEGG